MSSKKETIEPNSTVNFQLDSSLVTHQQVPNTIQKSAPVIEQELRNILPQISPEQQQNLAKQFLNALGNKGLDQQTLNTDLWLHHTNPEQMNPEDISKIATYTYQHYPDIFESILSQPNIVQFLTNPVLSAIVGIMAAKWLNQSPG